MKHLAKEVVKPSYPKISSSGNNLELRVRDNERSKQGNINDFNVRLPPLSYNSTLLPLKSKHRVLGPTEKLTLSRSQPDLSRIGKFDMDSYDSPIASPR